MPDRDARLPKVRCPHCDRVVSATYTADGTSARPRPHGPRSERCEGTYDTAVTDFVSEGHNYRGAVRDAARGWS